VHGVTEEEAREFIATARWRWAHTYAKWAPHWYVRKADSDPVEWTRFARFVWREGTDMHWRGGTTMVTRYWDHDGFMYWAGSEHEEVLVNRARILEPDPRTPA
jgi:hypothetical protein